MVAEDCCSDSTPIRQPKWPRGRALLVLLKHSFRLRRQCSFGLMAGAFIAVGSLYYTLIAFDPTLGFAATRVLGGVVFSVGLVLIVVAGGELFTGNNLIAMGWAEGAVSASYSCLPRAT
jgi:formate/nitrite transporter FocA (FNT family)